MPIASSSRGRPPAAQRSAARGRRGLHAADADAADVTVVIDVLRATTTIVRALRGRLPARALRRHARRRARAGRPGRVLAGERRCVRPPGFALGNSPGETDPPRGDELVLATTNGTPAILRAAALSPRRADRLPAQPRRGRRGRRRRATCSCCAPGTDGRPSLEDIYVAGRLAERLGGPASDAALLARAVARRAPGRLAAGAGAPRRCAPPGSDTTSPSCAQESVDAAVRDLARPPPASRRLNH